MEPKLNQPQSIVFIFGVLSLSYIMGAGIIGCGDKTKNQEKKKPSGAGNTSTKPNTGTSSGGTQNDATATSEEETAADGSEAKGSFFTSSDFPKATQKLSSKAAKEFLTKNLGRIVPTLPDDAEDTLECMKALDNVKWTGDAKSITLKLSKTLDCKGEKDTATYDIRSEGALQYTCEKDAFKSIVGKTSKSTKDTKIGKYCQDTKATFRFNLKLEVSLATNDDPENLLEFPSKSAISTAKGAPCTIKTTKNSQEYIDGCQGFYTETTLDPITKKMVKKTVIGSFKDAKGPLDATVLSSGTFEFSANNWKGTVTFKSNSKPKFKASDGDEEITGTVD